MGFVHYQHQNAVNVQIGKYKMTLKEFMVMQIPVYTITVLIYTNKGIIPRAKACPNAETTFHV